jgi:hypothetical protein
MSRSTTHLAAGLSATALSIVLVATGSTSAAAAGTTNGNAGCVAQVTTVEGPPGESVPSIRMYVTPVPGRLFSAIAVQDRDECELP